jgi:D-alanyl-D-alanine carboxypeptidase
LQALRALEPAGSAQQRYAALSQTALDQTRVEHAGTYQAGIEPAAIGQGGEPPQDRRATAPRKRGKRVVVWASVLVVIVLVLAAGAQFVRPAPVPAVALSTATSHTFPGAVPALPWPVQGQATVEVEGLGSLGNSGVQRPTPTASVAKVMTAYVFLKDHPLRVGQPGPTYTIGSAEAARLAARKARDESLIDVVAGQPFTEREALQAMLIVSANNIAHEIARWDAGGDTAFTAKMNATARGLGMTSTTYTDPSGYNPTTVSTSADQVKLLRVAMRIPVFAQIVAETSYTPSGGAPMAGNDTLLGQDGVIGGKTGNTDQAGANFVFAARRRVDRTVQLIVGAVMAQPTTSGPGPALDQSRTLIEAVGNTLTGVTLATKGQTVAHVNDGYRHRIPLTTTAPITVVGWPGLTVQIGIEGTVPKDASAGSNVATVVVGEGNGSAHLPVTLTRSLHPSLLDRLIRIN